MNEFLEIIRLSKECLSDEAYKNVIRIIEQDKHCIIDIGVGEEPGPTGKSYSSKNMLNILSMPLELPPDN